MTGVQTCALPILILPYDIKLSKPELIAGTTKKLLLKLDKLKLKKSPVIIIDACYDGPTSLNNNERSSDLYLVSNNFSNNYNSHSNQASLFNVELKRSDGFYDKLDRDNCLYPIIIQSSSKGQLSLESSKLKHGLFTYYFYKSLIDFSGTDINKDKRITYEELLNRVNKLIQIYLSKYDLEQRVSICTIRLQR